MLTQNQILMAAGAVVFLGLVYYFFMRKTDTSAKKDGYEWSSNVNKSMGQLDYFDPAVDAPQDQTSAPTMEAAVASAQNDMGAATVPGESNVVMAQPAPASPDTNDLLSYFEKQYPSADKNPELRAMLTKKLRFKENVKMINPQITVDDHPDLDLQHQIEGVDIKDVSTYDNNHLVPMSYVSKKLYDSFNTTVGPRQVYPLEGDYVKVSNFGTY